MAVKLNESVRVCRILTAGPVATLGGISGPITKCKLTSKQIVTIMRSGHRVAEYNPNKSGEYVELTLDNNGESPFVKAPNSAVANPVKPAEKKEKKQVVEENPVTEEMVDDIKSEPVEPVVTDESAPVDTQNAEEYVEELPSEETVSAEESNEENINVVSEEEAPTENLNDTAQDVVPESAETPAPTKKEIVIDVNTSKGNGGSKKSKKSASGNQTKK